jgi:hypothetical protein
VSVNDLQLLLIGLHKSRNLDDRRELIAQAEGQGLRVLWRDGEPYLVDGAHRQTWMERRTCEVCGASKPVSQFFGVSREMPWCKPCRKADPAGAGEAADRFQADQRYYEMSPEERRAKDLAYEARYPGRRDRSIKHLKAKAREIALAALYEACQNIEAQCQRDYTQGQREALRRYLNVIIEGVEQQ